MSQKARTPLRLSLAAVALAVASAAGCSSEGTDSDVSAGDPGYTYEVIASMRDSNADDFEPRSLADALPNRQIVVRTDQGGDLKDSFSDVVVAGRITKVTPDEGVFYPNADSTATGDEEADAKVVGFDNPDAHERIALVNLQVAWSAGAKVGKTLQFRIGVPMETDANKYLAGVRGIDDAVVLLEQFEDGRYEGDYYPILGFAGLGSVGDDGTVLFEGFGDEASDFNAGIGTLDELKAEASKPDTTLRY